MRNVWLHRYSQVVAALTLLPVVAGGLVTSNDAGLPVIDWPLSYGKLMPKMEGGILFEHGHRIAGAPVVTGMILWMIVRILVRHSDHTPLRRSALALLAITTSQVFLGIAAYMSRIAMRRPAEELAPGGVTVAS